MVIGVALIGAIGAGSVGAIDRVAAPLCDAAGVRSARHTLLTGHGSLVDHHLLRGLKLTLRKKLLASALVGG